MMLIPGTLTAAQEDESRAKVFHLLKKWSSLTFVSQAVEFYRDFLNAYERNLHTPSPNQKELEHRYRTCHLRRMIELERGVELLSKGSERRTAYEHLQEGQKFTEYIWGGAAEHWGVEHDPFFNKMGRGGIRDVDGKIFYEKDTGLVRNCEDTNILLLAMKCTINFEFEYLLIDGKRADGGVRVFDHWTYESIFQKSPPFLWCDDWPPWRHYPKVLTPCPAKNESKDGQVFSGDEIQVDGIYEPWLLTGHVGCPNYMLRGSIAHKYQREGTNDRETVRWRLIWQDDRYLDGKDLPIEEADYAELSRPKLPVPASAYAEEPCPQKGRYTAPRLGHRKADVQRGQPMPGPVYTNTGAVVWYLIDDKRAGSPREDGDGQAE